MAVLFLVISSAGESKGGLLRRLTESENDAEEGSVLLRARAQLDFV